MAKSKFVIWFLLSGLVVFGQESFKVRDDHPTVQDTTSGVKVTETVVKAPVKVPVAVLELDANGVTEVEAKTLSDRLRNEIFNAQVFEVMERDKMNSILNEMEFQLSGCTSNECVIEAGRLIGVNKMIAGSIGKVGEIYTVSVRLISVENGKIEATAIEDVAGSLGDVLTKAMPAIARTISGLGKTEYTIESKPTGLNITTEPVQAAVYLDGIYKGISPIILEVTPNVNHIIKIGKIGYISWSKTYTLEKEQMLDVSVSLAKETKTEIVYQEKTIPNQNAKPKRDRAFSIRYVRPNNVKRINEQIQTLNEHISDGFQPFKEEVNELYLFSEIKNFQGIEFYTSNVYDAVGFDFCIGIFRGDMDKWFKQIKDGEELDGYNLVTWSPQITADLVLIPIQSPFFYPFIKIGYGVNGLLMTAFYDNDNLGGPVYYNFGYNVGAGFEVRPFRFFGISVDWMYRNMEMRLLDLDNKVIDRFQEYGEPELNRVNLTGNNIGASLHFYY